MPAAKTKPAPSPDVTPPPANSVTVAAPTPDNPDNAKAMTVVTYAEQFVITSASDSAKAQEERARLNTEIKALTDKRMELTRPLDALKKKWMDFFGAPIGKFQQALTIFDGKILAWETEQNEIRQKEQRRLDDIARKEQQRLQGIADEAKRKADAEAEQLRKDSEAAAAAGRAEEAAKLASKATRVEEKAADKADVFESRAAAVVAPIAVADTARIGGTSFREYPEFVILDPARIKPEFMMPDEVKIGRVVRSLGKAAVDVVGAGGIKVEMRKGLSSRRVP
jgi:hypothetical protein